jgi:hypothetical protein
MKDLTNRIKSPTDRRSFIQRALAVAGTASVGAGLLSNSKTAFGEEPGRLTAGDAAILRFLAARRNPRERSLGTILGTQFSDGGQQLFRSS